MTTKPTTFLITFPKDLPPETQQAFFTLAGALGVVFNDANLDGLKTDKKENIPKWEKREEIKGFLNYAKESGIDTSEFQSIHGISLEQKNKLEEFAQTKRKIHPSDWVMIFYIFDNPHISRNSLKAIDFKLYGALAAQYSRLKSNAALPTEVHEFMGKHRSQNKKLEP